MATYPGISSEAFRHPLDRQAEQALRSVPGFDLVARKFVEFLYERPHFVYQMGNSIQVGPRQYASIYQMFRDCLRDLDMTTEPTLFVSQAPLVNAYALGQELPCVVLNTGLLDVLSADELRSVLAHELGHVKCGHTTLTQMAMWVNEVITGLAEMTFGLSSLVSTGLLLAFAEWQRKAELSADRAALLVIDELPPVMQSMMRLAGGSSKYINEISLVEFEQQSDRYQQLDQDGLNQIYKFLLYNNISGGTFLTHPFTVERISYLRDWANSPEFSQIRQGHYPRAGAEGSVNVPATAANQEVANLQQQIEELRQEIERRRSQGNLD